MAGEFDELMARAQDLATLAAGRPEAERAEHLLGRVRYGQFLVAIVGEFKRGKSTLVNALLGHEVVPSGVLPLTAVVTEIRYGDPSAVVELHSGERCSIDPTRVAEYVTEVANPSNERGVERVEVYGRWPILEPGIVLVDTPGIGSVYLHNTEAGRSALVDADGAVLVLSADAPMSEQEREFLGVLAERRSPTFFVLNKADHLVGDELAEVRGFVEAIIKDLLGHEVPLFALNARAALACRRGGDVRVGDQGIEFDAFATAFEHFVIDDLAGARADSARAELHRLGISLRDSVQVEEAAAQNDSVALAALTEQFSGEAARQRRAFEDDRTLLARDVSQLIDDVTTRLSTFAVGAPAQYGESLAVVASTASRARLIDDLRAAVEGAVRTAFETFRRTEVDRLEQAWREIAESFRSRTQHRVNAARVAAAEIFAVPLPQLLVPAVSDERERFSYLFIHVGSSAEPVGRALGRLVPARLARRRALVNARADLAAEFDKHAGRARWDLAQRLEDVRRDIERAMRSELDRSIDAVGEAAARAQQWLEAADDERRRRRVEARQLQELATELVAMGGASR